MDEASVAFYFAFRNTNSFAKKRIRQSGKQILSTIDMNVFLLKGRIANQILNVKRIRNVIVLKIGQ